MKFKFFHDPFNPNFGDELNPFIFNQLFGNIFNSEKYNQTNFYAIGTLLDERVDPNFNTVIFGTGIRNIGYRYDIGKWDIRFVRGPITSNVLGLKGGSVVTDSAYCLNFVINKSQYLSSSKYKISIIPHFLTFNYIPWRSVCNALDLNLIDPRWNIEMVLEEISSSEKVIAGAMHGAIVADFFRVPWIRLKMEIFGSETSLESDIKWLDWMLSLNLQNTNIPVKLDFLLKNTGIKKLVAIQELKSKLKIATNSKFYQVSKESDYNKILERSWQEIQNFIKDYS